MGIWEYCSGNSAGRARGSSTREWFARETGPLGGSGPVGGARSRAMRLKLGHRGNRKFPSPPPRASRERRSSRSLSRIDQRFVDALLLSIVARCLISETRCYLLCSILLIHSPPLYQSPCNAPKRAPTSLCSSRDCPATERNNRFVDMHMPTTSPLANHDQTRPAAYPQRRQTGRHCPALPSHALQDRDDRSFVPVSNLRPCPMPMLIACQERICDVFAVFAQVTLVQTVPGTVIISARKCG